MNTSNKVDTLLKLYGKENKILIGVIDTEPLTYLYDKELKAPFVNYTKEERLNPLATLPSAKAIVMIGVGYGKKIINDIGNVADTDKAGVYRVRLSLNAVGTDYHIIVKHHLKEIENIINQYYDCENLSYVDTGPLMEKEFFKKTGLAQQGKNTLMISNEFGSYFNIGYTITTADLKTDIQNKELDLCGNCNICIRHCPGNALGEHFQYEKCASYLTQTKKELTIYEEKIIGTTIYGCDICQTVCPYNKEKFIGDEILYLSELMPKASDLLDLSNRTFKEKYKDTNIYWRGKKVIQRNTEIACRNKGDF